MKEWKLLIWFPQFSISVVSPVIIFLLLAKWLRTSFNVGAWVTVAAIILGLITAFYGARDTLKVFKSDSSGSSKKVPVSFNDHK